MKKIVLIMICALMILVIAAGCAQEPTSEASADSTQSSKPADTEQSKEPEEPSSQEPREAELNIMMSFPQYMEQWETYVEQFEAKMLAEKNIKVSVNLEMPSSDQYDNVLQARLTSDDAPDLFALQRNQMPQYNQGGYLSDLSGEELAGKIYDNVKATVTIDGKLLAVPIESQAWGCLYNKEIFDACGLSTPNTLDEMKNVCDVLKQKGYTPFLLAFQDAWVPQLMTAVTIGGKVSGEVPDWVERMREDDGSYEEIRDIFGAIDVIMQNGTERAMETGYEVGCADFANGKAAMFVQGTWAAGSIIEVNPDIQIGVMALPVNNNEACTLVNLSTSTTLCVSPQSNEQELALAFANYVLDDNDSSALFQACVFNPLATCHDYEASSWVAEASAYVAEGRAYQDLVLGQAVTDEQQILLQEYYVDTVTQDEFIQRMDETFQTMNSVN